MWYLPIKERLKRLYQSERTAAPMRWHAQHNSDGEIAHPSDAEAWKHFQELYPSFASEPRNVYLGLSTDGFNPFGKHGRQYSLWPVIVTPYNLPPSLCMKREFLFLTILVPEPEHPKRSLDIFLQPLIYELKLLWKYGIEAYDVSLKQNFVMRAVFMWTISDFPAYGMLSGWSTHGRLACPYCQDNTDAFQLRHGRKTSWFDCHRRFLPPDHPYRRSTTLFRKNKKIYDAPPPEPTGLDIIRQLRDFDAEKTVSCGGNGHVPIQGCGEYHNWNKKSIFFDLPYWKDHLLRHNLDVMHIEKNFFDNIMNTVLNVQGKTKDNLKARLDLPDICSRKELHVMENGKSLPPAFRLNVLSKEEFFDWIKESVKFLDGYASNLRNCVDSGEGKLCGMKSHDCHVFMQRLLPFAFSGLLPKNIHEAIAGISAFFRDLCTRSLTVDGIHNLEEKIPVILCNLEKIFPPAFFDVMEHLPIHLPREAALGGPVQYRWMYPFERYMFHLKKKVKNLARVEGSIVAQCINEERSTFAGNYFSSSVKTKSRRPARHDDGGVPQTYPVEVPNIFTQIGRVSGKEYERVYMLQIREWFPSYTEDELMSHKQKDFAGWLQWHAHKEGNSRITSSYGISSTTGDFVYYGILREILEVQYPEMVGLKCIVFYCDWYDPVEGLRTDQFGVTSINSRKRLRKYDPFILGSQADQVCYIKYPRVTSRQDPWMTVTTIHPRGRVYGVSEHEPLQENVTGNLGEIKPSLEEVDLVVDFTDMEDDYVVYADSEPEIGEFDEHYESGTSEYSSDSD
ncbi:uncharacterized protein LOC112083505 [Eutrema salsugineum]|uniref:uncharacterized protein LOC112083505 n=1 Tax=Eutrema salsugineum TaxID=72664 RepID=UPI000CED1532|nr:uncharacterized protein LOC112083505 [Eutrema salsugineum]